VPVKLTRADGKTEVLDCRCRIDTATELTYYQNDGILHYVIRKMLIDKTSPARVPGF
jgi:aconitate hydratase